MTTRYTFHNKSHTLNPAYFLIGRGQRRHRDRGTGSTPYIILTLLDMKKSIYA